MHLSFDLLLLDVPRFLAYFSLPVAFPWTPIRSAWRTPRRLFAQITMVAGGGYSLQELREIIDYLDRKQSGGRMESGQD